MYTPAHWLKTHYRWIWWLVFLASASPAVMLAANYQFDRLGINPLATLMHSTGRYALIFLTLSLVITPLRRSLSNLSKHLHATYGRRLSDWNWIVRLRRMLGLYSFFYALLHVAVYVGLDVAFDWSWALQDIREKPYMLVGLMSFVLLIPLAATSTDTMMRRLGRNWRRLHRLVYLIALLSLAHFWWSSKVGVYDPWPYTAIILFLLLYRMLVHYGLWVNTPRDDGMVVPERGRYRPPAE